MAFLIEAAVINTIPVFWRKVTMRCIFCNCDNPDYAVVCEFCGEFLPKEDVLSMGTEPVLDPKGEKRIRCSYCWHSNPAEGTICEVCGMPLRYVPYPEAEGDYADLVKREDLLPKVEPNENPIAAPVPPGMIRCRGCRSDNPDTSTFCDQCGKRLVAEDEEDFETFRRILQTGTEEPAPNVPPAEFPVVAPVPEGMIRCPRCRNDVPKDSFSCFHCGKWLMDIASDDRMYEHFADHVKEINEEATRRKEDRAYRRELRRQAWNELGDAVGEKFDSAKGVVMSGVSKVPGGKKIRRVMIEHRRHCACGFENDPDAVYCKSCGGRLLKECSCGALNNLHATYCKNCGVILRGGCTCGSDNAPEALFCRKCGGILRRKCACGTANPLFASFCRNCGVLLKKRCTCGSANPPHATFCSTCGGRLLTRCDCGSENFESANYCRSCGKLLRTVCDCGYENAPGDKYCRNCGGIIIKGSPSENGKEGSS